MTTYNKHRQTTMRKRNCWHKIKLTVCYWQTGMQSNMTWFCSSVWMIDWKFKLFVLKFKVLNLCSLIFKDAALLFCNITCGLGSEFDHVLIRCLCLFLTDGRLLFVTPMDPLYLILPYLIKSGQEVRTKTAVVLVMFSIWSLIYSSFFNLHILLIS